MMSSILQRAVTPLVVAVIWIFAIFTMAAEPVGGLEPLFAGLLGGAAFVLQAFAAGGKHLGMRQVFALKASVAAGGAIIAFVLGAALSLATDPMLAAQPVYRLGQIAISVAGASSFLVRLGIALTIATVVAQSSLALLAPARSEP